MQRLTQSLRREVDRLRDRLRGVETKVADLAQHTGHDALEEFRGALAWARSSIEQLLATNRQTADTIEDVQLRIVQIERRIGEVARESAREVIDADEVQHKLSRLEHWVSDVARDVGSKQGELTAFRERLTRLETRFVNSTKEEAARAATGATLKERQARIEARVGDLTKELLARSIDLSNFKERVAHLEAQLAGALQSEEVTIDGPPQAAVGNR